MMNSLLQVLAVITVIKISLQNCPEEISGKALLVKWKESKPGTVVVSNPLCYNKEHLITRLCSSEGWYPPLKDLEGCWKLVESFDLSSCPPGYEQVTKINNRYCYQIGAQSAWNNPCLTNGGASIITDLTTEEKSSLLKSLRKTNTSRYFWLPAQRRKAFSPVVWNIPGPNWGQTLILSELMLFPALLRNCLMLDIETGIITTETCSKQFPSICIYLQDMEYPAKCPDGYYGFRFLSDNGTCFGIAHSSNPNGDTFDEFTKTKCSKPMGNSKYKELSKFIFMSIAERDNLPQPSWCWFESIEQNEPPTNYTFENLTIIVNNNGSVGIMNSSRTLPCMACETQMVYNGETTLELEYMPDAAKLFLTIYFPSGLWKYDNDDIGVQCFSDAKGFFIPINIDNTPYLNSTKFNGYDNNSTNVEKSIYAIDLITNRSAQYWCEAHNKSFSLLSSTKVIVNPTTNQLHAFALVVKAHLYNETLIELEFIQQKLTDLLKAEKVLLMDYLEYHVDFLLMLFHVHVSVTNEFENETSNLQATYESLKSVLETNFSIPDVSFVNISSSQYCFPTTSYDYMLLEWDLTIIGQVAAPKQFCLQSNGLPVKRHCLGPYPLGATWGEVEGHCNETYEPSTTTTFLYNFARGQVPENCTSRFLIDGLGFVLDDVDIIIPADIYYLSMSFQTILSIAHTNDTSIEMGDVENMAWAMDRILLMDPNYLRLSQTFNSTNVILDSVNDIFEKLAEVNMTSEEAPEEVYQLSVKPQFVVQISYPKYNNITGIALSKRTESDRFTDMIITPLYSNSSTDSVISIENLEVATWVPSIVLNCLQKNSNTSDSEYVQDDDVHVVINIYHNDAIFQELDQSSHVINSRIVGITIPGYKTNLVHSIPLLFKELQTGNSTARCGFWNFQSKSTGSNPGFWSNHGCFYQKSINNITVCRCYHMTHFGQLLDISKNPGSHFRNLCHIKALNIITLIGSFLSIFGIVGIWITALVFERWRKKPSTKVLLHLSSAIALPLLFMVIFNLDNTIFHEKNGLFTVSDSKQVTCIVLGALLQYSILASFMWMLITAILQFVRYVRVLGVCRPSRFMCKFAIVGWGVPLIPTSLVLLFNYRTYIPDPTSDPEYRICYPCGIYLIMGVIVPICAVLIINVVLFSLVLISISQGPEGKMKTSDMDLVRTQLRLSLFLFFLLGLTWIFGLFSFSSNLLWSYLFCLTSTMQGFVLFIYFVICDPATRGLWVSLMTPQFLNSSSSPRKSISSISSS